MFGKLLKVLDFYYYYFGQRVGTIIDICKCIQYFKLGISNLLILADPF